MAAEAGAKLQKVRVADGVGNVFQVEKDKDGYTFRYEPMKPMQSSSGHYDGGQGLAGVPVSLKVINELEHKVIALQKSDEKVAERRMGTSIVEFNLGEDSAKFYARGDTCAELLSSLNALRRGVSKEYYTADEEESFPFY